MRPAGPIRRPCSWSADLDRNRCRSYYCYSSYNYFAVLLATTTTRAGSTGPESRGGAMRVTAIEEPWTDGKEYS